MDGHRSIPQPGDETIGANDESTTQAGSSAPGPATHRGPRPTTPQIVDGKFEITGFLGEGAMGQVYKARQLSLGRDVALKVLSPELSHDQEYVGRFDREARAAAAMAHPNVVGVIDRGFHGGDGATPGLRYIAFEFVDGTDLEKVIKERGRIGERETLAFGRDICKGLRHANEKGLVHRDIKPANIMISREGVVKVADLGLAKQDSEATDLTTTGAVVGTPHYMSPEQANGERDPDIRGDLYALGLVLFRLATGTYAFHAKTAIGLLTQRVTKDVPDPRDAFPSLSAGFAQLVKWLTERELEVRCPTPAAALPMFEELLGRPGQALPPSADASIPPDPRATLAGFEVTGGHTGVSPHGRMTGVATGSGPATPDGSGDRIGLASGAVPPMSPTEPATRLYPPAPPGTPPSFGAPGAPMPPRPPGTWPGGPPPATAAPHRPGPGAPGAMPTPPPPGLPRSPPAPPARSKRRTRPPHPAPGGRSSASPALIVGLSVGIVALVVVVVVMLLGPGDGDGDVAGGSAGGTSAGSGGTSAGGGEGVTVETPRRASWPEPGDPWRSHWTLADGEAPRLAPAALWGDDAGRLADPLRGAREGARDALAAAFLGEVVPGVDEHVSVLYDLERAITPDVSSVVGFFVNGGPAAIQVVRGPDDQGRPSVQVGPPNDSGLLLLRVGSARWSNPKLDLRLLVRNGDHKGFDIRLGARARARRLWGTGRSSIAGVGDQQVQWNYADGAWHSIRFAPGEADGRRVILDERPAEKLDGATSIRKGSDGPLAIELGEASFGLSSLRVEGRPIRTDVAAAAVVPGAVGSTARVAAAFTVERAGSGGPWVGLGSAAGDHIRLEIDGERLVLHRDGAVFAHAALEDRAARADGGWLSLERTREGLVAVAELDGERVELVAHAPVPIATTEMHALYGSTAPRVRFEDVEVWRGAEDATLARLDAAMAGGGARPLEATIAAASGISSDPVVLWHVGGMLLEQGRDPRRPDARHLFGRPASGQRQRVALDAAKFLERAANGLDEGPLRADALARGAYAGVLAGRNDIAGRLGRGLVESVGVEAARERVDRLEYRDDRPRLVEHLIKGLDAGIYDLRVVEAATHLIEVIAPDREADMFFMRGFAISHTLLGGSRLAPTDLERLREEVMPAFERSIQLGHEVAGANAELGHIYAAMGKPRDAIRHYTVAVDLHPWSWDVFIKLANLESELRRDPAALRWLVCAIARRPGVAGWHAAAAERARTVGTQGGQPGLAAVCFQALAHATAAIGGDPSAREAHLRNAVVLAERAMAGSPDERDLGAYVLACHDRPAPADVLGSDRPTAALARARARIFESTEDAKAILEAAKSDQFIRNVAILDPVFGEAAPR